ncbi:MAG: serine/threonine-protein kinase [Myxococcota bacterium]
MSDAGDSRFHTLFELASGGMGRVYVAQRREGAFRRLYAVKRLPPDRWDDEESRAAFLDEARLAGLITHSNVVSVLDYGVDDEGPFLVMDLIEGVSLMRLMKASRRKEIPFPLPHVVAIGARIADGLSAAHQLTDEEGKPLQVVHRDVSPQNVLVGFDGSVRLTDFGIARARERHSHTTEENVLKGKLAYMSPEQLHLQPADTKSDLFALGIVLQEMAAGEALYRGDDAARRIVKEPPPNLRARRADVPKPLRDLVQALLAKNPQHRPATAARVAKELHALHAELVVKHGSSSLADFILEVMPDAQIEFQGKLREAMTLAGPRRTRNRGIQLPWLVAAGTSLLAVGLVAALAFALQREGAPATDGARASDSSSDPVSAPTSASNASASTSASNASNANGSDTNAISAANPTTEVLTRTVAPNPPSTPPTREEAEADPSEPSEPNPSNVASPTNARRNRANRARTPRMVRAPRAPMTMVRSPDEPWQWD